MDQVSGIVDYLLANPIFLVPLLLMVAGMLYAILKKLIKMAAIVAIAGALYLALMEYFGSGFDGAGVVGPAWWGRLSTRQA